MSFRKASQKYAIPKSTIRDHVTGRTRGVKPGPPTLLTKEEEEVLVNFIHVAERRAMPVTVEKIFSTVEAILLKESQCGVHRTKPSACKEGAHRPSKKWWQLFMKRHPDVSIRTPENLTKARKSVTKQSITQWFASAKGYSLYRTKHCDK